MNSDLVLPRVPRAPNLAPSNRPYLYDERGIQIHFHVLNVNPPPRTASRAIRRPAYRRSQSETLSRVRPRRSVSAHPRRHQPLTSHSRLGRPGRDRGGDWISPPRKPGTGCRSGPRGSRWVGSSTLDAVWRPGARRRDRPVPEVGEEPIRTKDVIQQDGGILASGSAPRHMCSSPACPGTAR